MLATTRALALYVYANQSNGQGTFWGSVKRSSSVLGHYLRHYCRSRGVADPFAHAQLIDGQGSRAKIRRGQAVKAVFRRSKILTPVAALDTAMDQQLWE